MLTFERRAAERRFMSRIDQARQLVVEGRISPNTAQRRQLAALAELQHDDLVTGEIVVQLPPPSYSQPETPRRAVGYLEGAGHLGYLTVHRTISSAASSLLICPCKTFTCT